MKKIMLSAGEVSGDVHGSYLVKELKKLAPDAYFFGMGSEKLKAAGVDIKFDITKRGTIGLIEALPNLFPIYFIFRKLVKLLETEKPDILILIDSQGINMPLAAAAKKRNIKTVYYIAPQEWLWGTEKGIKKVVETIDLIVAVFEKECEIYKKAGGNVIYFGHPLLDIVLSAQVLSSKLAQTSERRTSNIEHRTTIALCPGSRTQEIRNIFPILLEAAKLIQKQIPDVQFLIPAASKAIADQLASRIQNLESFQITQDQTYQSLASSDLVIATSGTINLEATILGIPNIMVYKLSPLTYWIGKKILHLDKKLKYFSMPNIIADQKIIPELIMGFANPTKIASEASLALMNRKQTIKDDLRRVVSKLGMPGSLARIARAIIS